MRTITLLCIGVAAIASCSCSKYPVDVNESSVNLRTQQTAASASQSVQDDDTKLIRPTVVQPVSSDVATPSIEEQMERLVRELSDLRSKVAANEVDANTTADAQAETNGKFESLIDSLQSGYRELAQRFDQLQLSFNSLSEITSQRLEGFGLVIEAQRRTNEDLRVRSTVIANSLAEFRNYFAEQLVNLNWKIERIESEQTNENSISAAMIADLMSAKSSAEARLAALESSLRQINNILPTLATKAELSNAVSDVGVLLSESSTLLKSELSAQFIAAITDTTSQLRTSLLAEIEERLIAPIIRDIGQLKNRVTLNENGIYEVRASIRSIELLIQGVSSRQASNEREIMEIVASVNALNLKQDDLIQLADAIFAQTAALSAADTLIQQDIANIVAEFDRVAGLESEVEQLKVDVLIQSLALQGTENYLQQQIDFLVVQLSEFASTQRCSEVLILGTNTPIEANMCGNQVMGPNETICMGFPYFKVNFERAFKFPPIAAITAMLANTAGADGFTSDRDLADVANVSINGMDVRCGSSPSNSPGLAKSSCAWSAIGIAAEPVCYGAN